MNKEIINEYIGLYGSSYRKKEAEVLLRGGAIQNITETDGLFNVTIRDIYTHNVKVKESEDNIETSCSCSNSSPEYICEHEITVLLYFRDLYVSVDHFRKEKYYVYRDSSKWLKIPNYIKLDEQKVDELSVYINKINVNKRWVHRINDITKDGFYVYMNEPYSSAYTINFRIKNKDIETRCNCETSVQGLCSHQISTLKHILKTYTNKFFLYFTDNFLEKIQNDILKEYGIEKLDNFDNYFSLSLGSKIREKIKEKGRGLVKLKKYRRESDTDNVINVLKGQKENILKRETENKDKLLQVGYAFDFKNSIFDIVPIVGKPTKDETKLSSLINSMDMMDKKYSLDLSEEDNELINLTKGIKRELEHFYQSKYNEYLYSISSLDDDVRYDVFDFYLKKIRKIKIRLARQKYIYKKTESYRTSKKTLIQIKVARTTPNVYFDVSEKDDIVTLEPKVELDGRKIKISSKNVKRESPITLEYNKEMYFFKNAKDIMVLDEFKDIESRKMAKQMFNEFFYEYIKPIAEHYPINIRLKDYKIKRQKLKAISKRVYVSEMGEFMAFRPMVVYDNDMLINNLRTDTNVLTIEENIITKGYRDKKYEKEFYDFMKNLHPLFEKQLPESFYNISFKEIMMDNSLFDIFENLKKNEIEVFGIKDLKRFKYSTNPADVSINIKSETDWFDVNVSVKFGDIEIALRDIRKAVLKHEQYIKLSDGTIGILPKKWITKFENYFRQGQIKKNELKISKLNFSIINEMFNKKDYLEIIEELEEKRSRLQNFTEIKNAKIPENFIGELRNYQKSGYNWLNFLEEYKWGGILADDMGLGKTIQIIAFMLNQKKISKKANLIIIPTSLLFNWENEINKFAPTLKIYFLYGPDRTKDHKKFDGNDLVITTYGTMIRDIELLRKYVFNYVILDESQAIKNPKSRRFKAATLIRAKNRIAITGTPIENNTFDLYAQMDFLNPGFLGSQSHFKKNFSNPIDKEQNPVIAAELQRKISPFVLRRTKEQVATELPPKIEDYVFCEMESEQRKVYDAFKNKYRNMLLKKIDDDGLGSSKLFVLEGLTKLRQICDSPEILSDKEDYGKQSIKVKELITHVNEKTGNHKILVFSQFVKMLTVIRKELEIKNIKYEYLDGKSNNRKRAQSVDNFQENKDIRVFLISLKAGGTGLNLTAADYVYIVDPWWNPAIENQAIDRCYRIGQDKKVIAYRMICKDTIEEKIMKHQAKKAQIASEIIITESSFMKQLKKNDIEDLFS